MPTFVIEYRTPSIVWEPFRNGVMELRTNYVTLTEEIDANDLDEAEHVARACFSDTLKRVYPKENT